MKYRVGWLIVVILAIDFIPNISTAKELAVVTSIRPIHSLVSAVMAETGDPYLIMRGGESPHLYSMRTSDARALQEADVIFWVGEGLESFLRKAIHSLNPNATVVPFAQNPNLTRYNVREGGAWEKHTHHEEDTDHDPHEDEGHSSQRSQEQIDMHIWLDPLNAIIIVNEIMQVLSAANPEQALQYQRNAKSVIEKLEALNIYMSLELSGLQSRAFIQFHDAFQYLEKRFSLSVAGAVSLDPERQVSAGRIQAIREQILRSHATCIFTEPQFEPKLVEIITEDLDVETSSLDPIGIDIESGPNLYFQLMERNTESLKSCLTGN